MEVNLSYGRTGLWVSVPDERTTIISPSHLPPVPDITTALTNAIRNPVGTQALRSAVKPNQTIAISVCDITRPMPSSTVLPVLLAELAHIPKQNIVILIATGTHRSNTYNELKDMLGASVVDTYNVVNHNAFDNSILENVGETPNGTPIVLNRRWVESDFRITTGFVEPHFFAGFSGGPKMVAPGLASFDTIMNLHNSDMIGNPKSTWGITEGNPIHDEIRQIAYQTKVDFSVDVTINRDRKITSVHAGELFAVHHDACKVAKAASMRPVDDPFDVVITSNSGYPLDLNLYQSVKGMSAASKIVKEGGTIICAAECRDGIPEHGEYGRILKLRDCPEDLLAMVRSEKYNQHDQWQVQIQSQIQMKAKVYLKSSYLSESQTRSAHLEPVDVIEDVVAKALDRAGQHARLCVLPEGPQTIPFLRSE